MDVESGNLTPDGIFAIGSGEEGEEEDRLKRVNRLEAKGNVGQYQTEGTKNGTGDKKDWESRNGTVRE